MSAMNGLAVSFRRRFRLMGCVCSLVALMGLGLSTGVASAAAPPAEPSVYSALGDSLAFGDTQAKFNANYPAEPPSAFENGYADFLWAKLKMSSAHFGVELRGLKL